MFQEYYQAIEERSEKFKTEGLVFSERDGRSIRNGKFEYAFVKFVNEATQDEFQRVIDQIPTVQEKLVFLQNYSSDNLCVCVLNDVKDNNRKINVVQALFNAGIDPLFKRRDGALFLYSDQLRAKEGFNHPINQGVSEICLPYLKAVLFSEINDKFVKAVEEMHLGQLGFTFSEDMRLLVKPDFINLGIEAASEFLYMDPIAGRNILRPFYDNLTNPESILGKYCNDIEYLANENREELQKLNEIEKAGHRFIHKRFRFRLIKQNVMGYETLQKGIITFKDEFQEFPRLINVTRNIVNGVIKDKKSIEELPLPRLVLDYLLQRYNDTIHPKRREAYNEQGQAKLEKLAKLTESQISPNKEIQAAKNKRQSEQDIQVNEKSIFKRSRKL